MPPNETSPVTILSVPCTHDEAMTYAIAIADHLGKPVVVTKPDGTRHHVIPLDTAQFENVLMDSNHDALPADILEDIAAEMKKPVARGPHSSEDETGFGEPYDSFGG